MGRCGLPLAGGGKKIISLQKEILHAAVRADLLVEVDDLHGVVVVVVDVAGDSV